jgi:hypothetical protein
LILFAAGLTLAGIWTDVVGYSSKLLTIDQTLLTLPYSPDAFQLGRLAVSIVFILMARKLAATQNQLTLIIAVLMSTATGVLVISHYQTLVDPYLLASCGIFVASAGYSFIVWIFYLYAAQHLPTNRIVWSIAASLVLETIFSILISLYLGPVSQMALVVSAPILVSICYFAGTRLGPGRPQTGAIHSTPHSTDREFRQRRGGGGAKICP